jgi:hypothetical protein
MARPVPDSARSILSGYVVRLWKSYGEARDWFSEPSSVLRLRIVNAALDSREAVLTWLEGRSESLKLLSASPAVGCEIDMRLVRNGIDITPPNARVRKRRAICRAVDRGAGILKSRGCERRSRRRARRS